MKQQQSQIKKDEHRIRECHPHRQVCNYALVMRVSLFFRMKTGSSSQPEDKPTVVPHSQG